jgi:hypothetical protein
MRHIIAYTTLGFVLAGCASAPTGPRVAVMPAPGKPFELFVSEDQTCRSFAQQSIGESRNETAAQNFAGAAAVGTAVGAAAGALSGGQSGASIAVPQWGWLPAAWWERVKVQTHLGMRSDGMTSPMNSACMPRVTNSPALAYSHIIRRHRRADFRFLIGKTASSQDHFIRKNRQALDSSARFCFYVFALDKTWEQYQRTS